MIYFVDEDEKKLRSFVSELKFNNYKVEVVRDADTAFSLLQAVPATNVDLVIIDVMLAVHPDASRSRYNRDDSNNFMKTGLLLLADLVKCNPDVFPSKAVFFTHASSQNLLANIREEAKEYGIRVLRKSEFETAYQFAAEIRGIMKQLDEKK